MVSKAVNLAALSEEIVEAQQRPTRLPGHIKISRSWILEYAVARSPSGGAVLQDSDFVFSYLFRRNHSMGSFNACLNTIWNSCDSVGSTKGELPVKKIVQITPIDVPRNVGDMITAG